MAILRVGTAPIVNVARGDPSVASPLGGALSQRPSTQELGQARTFLAQSTDSHQDRTVDAIKGALNDQGLGDSVERITPPGQRGGDAYVGELKPGERITDKHREFERGVNESWRQEERSSGVPQPRFRWLEVPTS